jgi:hypothetical protein
MFRVPSHATLRVSILPHYDVAKLMQKRSDELTPGRWLRLECDDPPLDKLTAIDYVSEQGEVSPAESLGQSLLDAANILTYGPPEPESGHEAHRSR